MNHMYRDVEVGDTVYKSISLINWQCWKNLFAWLYTEKVEMSMFQGGQAAKVVPPCAVLPQKEKNG